MDNLDCNNECSYFVTLAVGRWGYPEKKTGYFSKMALALETEGRMQPHAFFTENSKYMVEMMTIGNNLWL